MFFFGKSIDALKESDLWRLVKDKEPETRSLDYKQELPSNQDEQKREFLSDVVAMVNGGGGFILYGVEEAASEATDSAIAKDIPGVEISDLDEEYLRVEQSVRSSISPRVQGFRYRLIPLKSGKYVPVLACPKSFNRPHMVSFKKLQRFMSRHSRGNFEMDIDEIRAAFLGSAEILDRMEAWESKRVKEVQTGHLKVGPRLVVHVMPFSAFEFGKKLHPEILAAQKQFLTPLSFHEIKHRFNAEGYIAFSEDNHKMRWSAVQFFREGMIEAADNYLLNKAHESDGILNSPGFEKHLIECCEGYLRALTASGISTPIVIAINLIGTNTLGFGGVGFHTTLRINQPEIRLPPVIANEDEELKDVGRLLRPCFDTLWNACGYVGSPHFSKTGDWAPNAVR